MDLMTTLIAGVMVAMGFVFAVVFVAVIIAAFGNQSVVEQLEVTKKMSQVIVWGAAGFILLVIVIELVKG